MSRLQSRICLGVIVGAHGVRGQVRVQSFTAEPAAIASYGPLSDEMGTRKLELELVGETRGQLLASVRGVEDRDAAEALKGLRLYVERAALPQPADEEYYHSDLVGIAVECVDGARLGTVMAVHDFGGGSVLEVGRRGRAPVMLPFTREVVPLIDLESGRLVVEPPAGLIADEAATEERR